MSRILDRIDSPVLRELGVVGLFGTLTVVHTWPLARSPWNRLHFGADSMSGMWSLNGLARQLVLDPGHLFDGNIFYPFPNTLAVLDHQIAGAIMSVPLVLAGAGGILVYNALMLATFFLSGVFTFLLVRRITGSAAAGLVAGCAFAFGGYRAYHLLQLHLLATQWVPLALWALHRYLERPTWRRWGVFAASTLMVALSSWHIAVIGALGIALVALWTMISDLEPLRRRVAGLVLVGMLCGAALVPLALTYTQMGQQWPPRTGEGRETMGTLVKLSANVVGLVARPDNVRAPYAPVLSRFEDSAPGVFPGIVVIALALPALALLLKVRAGPTTIGMRFLRAWLWGSIALVVAVTAAAAAGARGEALVALLRPTAPFVIFGLALAAAGLVLARRAGNNAPEVAPVVTYAAVAAAGALLALGPRVFVGPLHAGSGLWRLDLLPLGLIIRAPERLSLLLMLGTSVLAGIGTARLLRRFSPGKAAALSVLILVVLNADLAFRMPEERTVPPPREFETWLAESHEEGAVVDYPLHWTNLWTIAASQRYDRRIVNGTGYLFPWEYKEMEELPDLAPEQLAFLWEHFHPRFVVVRTELYEPAERARVLARIDSQPDALQLRARFGPDHIYELVDRGRGSELFRRWPLRELRDKSALVLEAAAVDGRDGTAGELTVAFDGEILLQVRGPEAREPNTYVIPLSREQLVRGMNVFEMWGDYHFTDPNDAYPIGTTGVSLAADVSIRSDRERARVQINGRIIRPDKGYFLIVLDPRTGEVVRMDEFNVSWYPEASDALAAFVRDIPDGSPVLVVTEYDASRDLQASAVEALGELGLEVDLRGKFQMLHAAIGVKGAPLGSAMETTDRVQANLVLGAPERRDMQIYSLRLRR